MLSTLIFISLCVEINNSQHSHGVGYVIQTKNRRNTMEKYVNPELEVLAATAADVIASSVTYDENEVQEDKFFSV